MHQMNENFLRSERMQLGWSQHRLAQALGVSIRTVRRWEQGHSVPYTYYQRRLSTLFGKTIQQLGLLKDTDKVHADMSSALMSEA